MPTAWQIGDRIENRWEIYNVLYGGVGVVYIVYDHQFSEPFAAKTFQDEVFTWNPAIVERFRQEALAWVGLDVHPNVTRARMVETIGGKPFLFLEYVSGGDLKGWIGTPRLTEDLPQVLRFAVQFCDGMTHARAKGLKAHRDIKPQNCLITPDGTLKVTDFGLAKVLDDASPAETRKSDVRSLSIHLSHTGMVAGTCTHMAPEQFADARGVDVRADIYSFGVLLFEMVTGSLPFVGETWEELERQHKTQPAPRLPGVDQQVAAAIETCLAKDPTRRFASFAEVRERLAEIYEKLTRTPAPQPVRGAELSAVEWSNKGASLGNLGRQEEAMACYDRALAINPSFAPAWFNKGVALHALQRMSEAIACYDRALELNPGAEQAWSNKGVALRALGKIEEAMACYDRALKLNLRYPDAWVNKGVALRASRRLEEAIACYDRALKLNPRDARAWSNNGNALAALGRHGEAIACYDRALELNPRLDQTWFNKGLALMTAGRHGEEIACYDRALALNPRHQRAWFNKGAALVNGFQRYREALPYFQEAERLGLSQATAAVALCRQMLGETTKL